MRFVIPNRVDATEPPTLYDEWGADVVPRVGEAVEFAGEDGEVVSTWIVKWVRHRFQLGQVPQVDVRLIEPDRWTVTP